jgi:hypothetical protein
MPTPALRLPECRARGGGYDYEIVTGVTLDSSAADIAWPPVTAEHLPRRLMDSSWARLCLDRFVEFADSGSAGRDADIFAKRARPRRIFDNIRRIEKTVYEDFQEIGHAMRVMAKIRLT